MNKEYENLESNSDSDDELESEKCILAVENKNKLIKKLLNELITNEGKMLEIMNGNVQDIADYDGPIKRKEEIIIEEPYSKDTDIDTEMKKIMNQELDNIYEDGLKEYFNKELEIYDYKSKILLEENEELLIRKWNDEFKKMEINYKLDKSPEGISSLFYCISILLDTSIDKIREDLGYYTENIVSFYGEYSTYTNLKLKNEIINTEMIRNYELLLELVSNKYNLIFLILGRKKKGELTEGLQQISNLPFGKNVEGKETSEYVILHKNKTQFDLILIDNNIKHNYKSKEINLLRKNHLKSFEDSKSLIEFKLPDIDGKNKSEKAKKLPKKNKENTSKTKKIIKTKKMTKSKKVKK